jgi:hypothetical protein
METIPTENSRTIQNLDRPQESGILQTFTEPQPIPMRMEDEITKI